MTGGSATIKDDDDNNEVLSWIQPTLNNRGVMVRRLPPNSQAFIEHAANIQHVKHYPVIDMGCAYGVATLPALERGARVIACDLEPKHLEVVQQVATERHLEEGLTIKPGHFPEDFDFAKNSIAAFHSSYVFHFLSGEQLMEGLAKVKEWLIPGGKIFLNVGTPFIPYLVNFQEEYERRIKKGESWPGDVRGEALERFINPRIVENHPPEAIPKVVHLFDISVFSRALKESGFIIEHMRYFNLDWPEELAVIYGTKEVPGMLEVVARS